MTNINEIYSVDTHGRVFAGYDRPLRRFYVTPEEEDDQASVSEKLALAEAMIARWEAYKNMVSES